MSKPPAGHAAPGPAAPVPADGRAAPGPDHPVGRHYDTWLTGGGGIAGAYGRWYLSRRRPHEFLRLLSYASEPRARLLEVGCATGIPLEEAARRGWGGEVLAGVDASEVALARAATRLAPLGDRVRLELACAESLPFADATFDAVTLNGVAKYLDDDALRTALAEARRVSAPGAFLGVADFGPRLHAPLPGVWRVAEFEQRHLRDAARLAHFVAGAGYRDVRPVDVGRMRRFPYGYAAVIATV